jgi:HK97 family phage prohead protease
LPRVPSPALEGESPMTDLNLAGESHAHSLIAAGKVDRTSSWSFSKEDGDALLGKGGDDWETYGKFHLGIDRAATEKTKGRYKYPVGKDGKVYRSGVIAAKSRAGQQGDGAIEKAADSLLQKIDKASSSSVNLDTLITRVEYKFVDDSAPAGTFECYASVYGNEDDSGACFKSGSFTRALAEHKANGTMPKMLLNHGGLPWGAHTAASLVPVGGWDSMAEDTHGLAGRAHLLHLDTDEGKRLYAAMKDKQIDAMSVTFKARNFVRGVKENEPRRTITDADLLEAGPVTWGANKLARVTQFKNDLRIGTIREFEDFLRDAGGFSAAAAKAIAAGGFKAATQPRDEGGTGDEYGALLRGAAGLLRGS